MITKGYLLKKLREALGLTAKDLSDRCGWVGTLSTCETGKRNLTKGMYTALSQAMGLPPALFLIVETDSMFVMGDKRVSEIIWIVDEMQRLECRLKRRVQELQASSGGLVDYKETIYDSRAMERTGCDRPIQRLDTVQVSET